MFNKIIYDNVHGRIVIEDELIWELIHTSEFQRLNRIKQLGLSHYLFPCATHSRFIHSLGVYENARKYLLSLSKKYKIPKYEIRIILIAALLHDLGHGPFSHFFEAITNINHEKITIQIIESKNTQINKLLQKYLGEGEINKITSIIAKNYSKKWINQLISSQVDVDRLDYLQRDSLNTGVIYGKVDIDWIIENTKIINNELVYEKNSIQAIESILLGRNHMFTRVYKNPKSYAFGEQIKFLFENIRFLNNQNYLFKTNLEKFKPIIENKKIPISKFLLFDDDVFMNFILDISHEKDKTLKQIASNILNGIIPQIFDLNNTKQLKLFNKKIQNKIENKDYSIIEFEENFYLDSIKDETLKIIKDNHLYPFNELSPLIQIEKANEDKIKIGVLI